MKIDLFNSCNKWELPTLSLHHSDPKLLGTTLKVQLKKSKLGLLEAIILRLPDSGQLIVVLWTLDSSILFSRF